MFLIQQYNLLFHNLQNKKVMIFSLLQVNFDHAPQKTQKSTYNFEAV